MGQDRKGAELCGKVVIINRIDLGMYLTYGRARVGISMVYLGV